ncbi:MAG TPA: AraC family transcriptional regulator [Faecalibacter sp.]
MSIFEPKFEEINEQNVDFYINHFRIEKIESLEHQHNKAQLLYAEGGIVHIFTNEKHWYLPARCFMIIPANVQHSLLSFSTNIQLYNFYFDVKEEDDDFYRKKNIYFANDLLREMIIFTKQWNGKLEPNTTAYDFLKAVKSILPEINKKEIPFPIQHPFPRDEKLIEIALFLTRNIEKNYTLEEIAHEFGMSSRTLSRKFKNDLGMNYIRFLRSLRITKSLELIAENKYNMYEIAMLVGYNSLSTFSNIFFKVLNMRPTEYHHMIQHRK